MANEVALSRRVLGFTGLPALVRAGIARGWWGNTLPPPTKGYVHEPFAGAWQRNIACAGGDPLAFSAVWASVTMISQDIAKLRPTVYKSNADGSKETFPNHPAQRVLDHPNKFQTRVDFWQHFMMATLIQGNSYTLFDNDQRGVISAMFPLDPYGTRPVVGEDGSVFYQINRTRLDSLETPDLIEFKDATMAPARRVMHHREVTVQHPLIGVSPLYAAAASAGMGATIIQNSASFFANMSRASGVLTSVGKIDKETADRLRIEWEQNFAQGSMGRTAVLGSGLEWKPLSINAADAQLIDQLKWNVEDVARCYRIPDWMISNKDKAAFRTAEMQTRLYYQQTLQFRLEAIEARLNEAFELANDVFIEFDLSTMLRTELDTRMKAFKDAISSGVYSINEARKQEELPPVPGGNEPLVQVQYQPLSQRGQVAAPAPAPAPNDPNADPAEDPNADPEDDTTDGEGDATQRALQLRRDLATRIRTRLVA